MAADDIYQVTLVSTVSDQRVVNQWHFKEVDACTDEIPAHSVAAMFEEVFIPPLFLALSIEAVGQCIYCRRLDPAPHIPYLLVLEAVIGDISGDAVPSNAAAVMSIYSVEFGRSGRGRSYISGIPESGVTGSLINDTQMDLLEDFSDLFINAGHVPPAPFDGSWKPVVWSPKNSEAHNLVESNFSPSMGSMRSRRQPYGMIP